MKGFLVTQQEAVETVLEAARHLRGDTAFDQQEVQETIETVEERWSELFTKVDEYETWLESSVQACKQYHASLDYIKNMLNDTDKRLGTSAAGNPQELKAQLEELKVRTFKTDHQWFFDEKGQYSTDILTSLFNYYGLDESHSQFEPRWY